VTSSQTLEMGYPLKTPNPLNHIAGIDLPPLTMYSTVQLQPHKRFEVPSMFFALTDRDAIRFRNLGQGFAEAVLQFKTE